VYPIFIFSKIAAGIIKRKVTQFQLLPTQSCRKEVNKIIRTIAVRLQGNKRKKPGFATGGRSIMMSYNTN
jgi:hypothetical protein